MRSISIHPGIFRTILFTGIEMYLCECVCQEMHVYGNNHSLRMSNTWVIVVSISPCVFVRCDCVCLCYRSLLYILSQPRSKRPCILHSYIQQFTNNAHITKLATCVRIQRPTNISVQHAYINMQYEIYIEVEPVTARWRCVFGARYSVMIKYQMYTTKWK